jgi:amino acid transporter
VWDVTLAPRSETERGFIKLAQAFDTDSAWAPQRLNGIAPTGTEEIGGLEWDVYRLGDAGAKQNLTYAIGGVTVGELYLVIILVAVYVCTLAIHGATVRLMFSMGRDRRLPLGGLWGSVNSAFHTPANASVAVGILAAIPFVITGAGSAIYIAIAATGMIYISYFLCNLGVLFARRKGWPHQGAWFKLGSWGTIINILALVWGGLMVFNIAIWTDPAIFGVFGNDLRNTWSNPFINTFIKIGGTVQEQLPAWPIFETTVGTVLVVGALYYLVAQRGKLDQIQVEADQATGEAIIG